jgi:hypothetical protein
MSHLNRLFLIILSLLAFSVEAQDDFQLQYTKGSDFTHGVALRGKVFAFPIIEDFNFVNAAIGTEVRLFKRHSLGVDWVWFRTTEEQDDEGPEGDVDKPLSKQRDTRKYLHVDYKLYIGVKWFETSRFTPYINLFGRFGVRYTHEQQNYISYPNTSYNYRASFQHYGVSIGTIMGFGDWDQFGLDVSFGVGNKYALVTEDVVAASGPDHHFSNRPETTIAPFARLNLYLYLWSR